MCPTDGYDPEMTEMVRCVQLYHRHGEPQANIAKELKISVSKVSRLLRLAYDQRIVKVLIDLPPVSRLAMALTDGYPLIDAVVIPSGQEGDIKRELGNTAARYFEKHVQPGTKVGLSCGRTLYYMVKHLRERKLKDLQIYALAAESTISMVDIFPNTLVGMMVAKYQPYVKGFAMQNKELFSVHPKLKAEMEKMYEAASTIDVAVVGVGTVGLDTPGFCALAEHHGLSPDNLKQMGAVGEVNYRPFDETGKPVDTSEIEKLTKHTTAVEHGTFRELIEQGKHVIAVAGGKSKKEAIHAALKGGLFNVLITDQEVASYLIDKANQQNPSSERHKPTLVPSSQERS